MLIGFLFDISANYLPKMPSTKNFTTISTVNKVANVKSLRIAILMLAAGEGSRAGFLPKALLKKNGETLLTCFCKAAKDLMPVEFILVTGCYASEIEAEAKEIQSRIGININCKRNPTPDNGQASSVRIGLESLSQNYNALLVALSDQPYIGLQELENLCIAFQERNPFQEVVLPIVKIGVNPSFQRGNPVIFSSNAIQTILATPGMSCREYLDAHPEKVLQMITGNPAYITDVDNQSDISKFNLKL